MDPLRKKCRVCVLLNRDCLPDCEMLNIFPTDELLFKLGSICDRSVEGPWAELEKIDKSQWIEFMDFKSTVQTDFKKFPVFGPLQRITDLSR